MLDLGVYGGHSTDERRRRKGAGGRTDLYVKTTVRGQKVVDTLGDTLLESRNVGGLVWLEVELVV